MSADPRGGSAMAVYGYRVKSPLYAIVLLTLLLVILGLIVFFGMFLFG